MGTRFAPSLANLYVGLFKTLYIMSDHNWKKDIVLYKHYIDDLIFIWQGSEKDFELFNNYLNENEWGLTFTGTINPKQIDYLDITLFTIDNKICTKKFFKKVDSNNFLDYKSRHHRKWLNNIPFGQLQRIFILVYLFGVDGIVPDQRISKNKAKYL